VIWVSEVQRANRLMPVIRGEWNEPEHCNVVRSAESRGHQKISLDLIKDGALIFNIFIKNLV